MKPPKEIDVVQGSVTWQSFRFSHIGASEVPIIMGVSPYMKPYDLWCIKTGRSLPKPPNAAMQHGTENESNARAAYVERTGQFGGPKVFEMAEWPEWISQDTFPPERLSASLDYYAPSAHVIAEFKCPFQFDNFVRVKQTQEVAEKDWPQVQAQLLVMANADVYRCDYVVSYGSEQVVIEVALDHEYVIEKMLPALNRFIDAVEDDAWPFPSGTFTSNDERQIEMANDYIRAKAELEMAKSKLEFYKKCVMEFAAPYERTEVGSLVVTQQFIEEKMPVPKMRKAYTKTIFKIAGKDDGTEE